ncbi:MAG: type II toxin -antitoxin system TacA 1-like antitoxin, partial [Acidimicrobiales bacterium]
DDLIVEAAGLAGVSVSEFLLDRAVAGAEALVHAHHAIQLDECKGSVNPYAQVTGGTGHNLHDRVCWWSWEPSPRAIMSTGGL